MIPPSFILITYSSVPVFIPSDTPYTKFFIAPISESVDDYNKSLYIMLPHLITFSQSHIYHTNPHYHHKRLVPPRLAY